MPYTVKAHRTSDSDKPPKYEQVSDEEVISKERRLRSSETDIHYHQSPLTKTGSQDLSLYPPVFDPQDTTAETHDLGSAEPGETKVEYVDNTPDKTEGAVGGSDPVTSASSKKLRSYKLKASKLIRSRDSSADSATSTTARDTGVEAATDSAASSSVSQQPEPSAPPGDITDQSDLLDQQLGSQPGQQSADQQPPQSQAQVAYNPQNPQPCLLYTSDAADE